MKIYLYLKSQVDVFYLPESVSGSYSFDYDDQEIDRLINVDSKDGKWYLSSTSVCKILNGSQYVEEVELVPDTFYVIIRNKATYLIYVTNYEELNYSIYNYSNVFDISVGIENATCSYNCPYIKQLSFRIAAQNGNTVLSRGNNTNLYLNKISMKSDNYNLKYGDEVSVYGVRIIYLCGMIFVFANKKFFDINIQSAHLIETHLDISENNEEVEIKDRNLFDEDDYFFKSPRLRRIFDEKEIELTQPPTASKAEDMPFLLTVGPAVTMAFASVITTAVPIINVISGKASFSDNISQIVMGSTMLLSSMLWPVITSRYNKKNKMKKEKETNEKYRKYLAGREEELAAEMKFQSDVIKENIISLDDCLENLKHRKLNFWDKRTDQNDFLVARVGVGDELLKVKVNNPKEGFSPEEDELKHKVQELVEKYKYIKNVPIGYSFYENKITAIMDTDEKSHIFVNNILFQLLTFYGYDDLKLVIFTNKVYETYWDYAKYLNHNMLNDSSFRFFASDEENAEVVIDYLSQVIDSRNTGQKSETPPKPYFLIVIDDIDVIRMNNIIEKIAEIKENIGFSAIILEKKLSKLPSLCNNFICLSEGMSGILKNSYEQQEQQLFKDEINPNINMMEVAKILSNIPIDLSSSDDEVGDLPDAITFLEMAKVGKVEQLNIMNRWNTNDSTNNLKAEIGVDANGKYMYLDLHEKAHGPHGLIAGMTGSGKSEFIITWILSVCMNFSPEDVAFILIDYKGGGLAYAFENKLTNVRLPHLAGTITNLDKSEINRTLVSIDSEVKRRQSVFNEARDKLGESTIDIYKYQGFFHEGKLDEPLPHLFIVCDEFAELRAQQPDFMQNLISVARIGRSLGVHLILATQKPSGVVDDQIWSNTKFRVCLKVQDAADSNEMLKRPEAASLKQTGRFYLQVGYDEYFALGQSGWCGAKYYPSDTIQKSVDKSVNVINDSGAVLKSIQSGSSNSARGEAQGEQLAAVLNEIINVATQSNKFAKRLWLDNIPEIITIADTVSKYNFKDETKSSILIGEYDAPELQKQSPLLYDYLKDGNNNIVSTDSEECEECLNMMIYSSITSFSSDEFIFYVIDYGSQSFAKYSKVPHCGGVVLAGDKEGYNNLLKLIKNEVKERKQILAEYGGVYQNYRKDNPGKMPIIAVFINGFDSMIESTSITDIICDLTRDSERYGIVYLITSNNALAERFRQTINSLLLFKLKDVNDYSYFYSVRQLKEPKPNFGRGICYNDGVLHEFQLAFACDDLDKEGEFILSTIDDIRKKDLPQAKKIPSLPEQIQIDDIKSKLKGAKRLPVGIERGTLSIKSLNLTTEVGKMILCIKMKYAFGFVSNLITEIQYSKENLIVLDPSEFLTKKKDSIKNYYDNNIETVIDKIISYIEEKKNTSCNNIIVICSMAKLINKLSDSNKISDLFSACKKSGNSYVLIVDEASKVQGYSFDEWYKSIDLSEGLYVGIGVDSQNILRIANYSRDLSQAIPINYGYYICDGLYNVIKLIEFERIEEIDDDED